MRVMNAYELSKKLLDVCFEAKEEREVPEVVIYAGGKELRPSVLYLSSGKAVISCEEVEHEID